MYRYLKYEFFYLKIKCKRASLIQFLEELGILSQWKKSNRKQNAIQVVFPTFLYLNRIRN